MTTLIAVLASALFIMTVGLIVLAIHYMDYIEKIEQNMKEKDNITPYTGPYYNRLGKECAFEDRNR